MQGYLSRQVGITIRNEREVARFVAAVTAGCVIVALSVDVINQLVFFVDWSESIRSWTVTVVLVPNSPAITELSWVS